MPLGIFETEFILSLFTYIFNAKAGYLQLMLFSLCVHSCSHMVAWWWPIFWAKPVYSFHWHVQNAAIPCIVRSFFHSSLLCTFSCHPSHQLFFHPLSPHLAFYLLVCLSILLFPNSYIILFLEFYFLPFSVHVQTNIIYLTLLSLL